jgi:hypothetical protein
VRARVNAYFKRTALINAFVETHGACASVRDANTVHFSNDTMGMDLICDSNFGTVFSNVSVRNIYYASADYDFDYKVVLTAVNGQTGKSLEDALNAVTQHVPSSV